MTIHVNQTERTLYGAKFHICRGEAVIGEMIFEGRMTSCESKIVIRCEAFEFHMRRIGRFKQKGKNPKRPYAVASADSNVGAAFEAWEKPGFFHIYSYYCAVLNQREYQMYPVWFGREGEKAPVYCGLEQIALLKRPAEIVNDFYNYEIICTDGAAMQAALVFCAYSYACGSFKPGKLVKKGRSISLTRTTQKRLLEKYQPEFEEMYRNAND